MAERERMKNGNWIPISKGFLKDLPHDREYTELEAAYSLQLDYDCDKEVTVAGYSDLWRWSRGRVYRFLERMNIEISYQRDPQKVRNQTGHIKIRKKALHLLKGVAKKSQEKHNGVHKTVHKTDIKRTYNGHIRLIENSHLREEKDIKRTYNGHKTDIRRNTTIDPKNLNTRNLKKEKESIKEKEKPLKKQFLEFVFLTEDEHQKLIKKFGDSTQDWIERLNDGIGSKGYKYKSHYHTILNWERKDRGRQEVKTNGIKSKNIDYDSIPGRD